MNFLAGTPYFHLPDDIVLFLEATEAEAFLPRVRRALTHLAQTGVLERTRALLLGRCPEAKDFRGVSLQTTVMDAVAGFSFPVIADMTFGHTDPMMTILIGPVASVIDSLNYLIQEKIESTGSRTYFVSRIPLGPRWGSFSEDIRKRRYLTGVGCAVSAGHMPISRLCDYVRYPWRFVGGPNVIQYGSGRVERIVMRGAEPEYTSAIPLFAVTQGCFLSHIDEMHARLVVVIGWAIAEAVFPDSDPIGKTVRLNGRPYEVIGVFAHDSGLFGTISVDYFAVIPFKLFRKEYPRSKEIMIAYSVSDQANPGAAKEEVTQAMRRLRRLKHSEPDDFEHASPELLSHLWSQLTSSLIVLTTFVSTVGWWSRVSE